MNMIQMILMCVGILMAVTGGLVHEIGAGYFIDDLRWIPQAEFLLAHPIGAIVVGVGLMAFSMNAGQVRRGR